MWVLFYNVSKSMSQTEPPELGIDWAVYVDQLSSIIQLPIPPECKAGVITNLERTEAIAQLVLQFPISEDIEVAPTFQP